MRISLLANIRKRLAQVRLYEVVFGLTILGLLAYGNAVFHPFVHDDIVFIKNNPHIAELDLRSIFFHIFSPTYQDIPVNIYYRPLVEFIHRLQYQIFGLNPHGFHLFNVLLHIANSFLVYLLIDKITQNQKGLSLAVAVIFLLHPVQTESVACISGVSNLIFAFLCLLSFYWYVLSQKLDQERRGILFYFFSLVAFFISFFAKVQAVSLPFLIILYELFLAGGLRKDHLKNFLKIVGYFIVTAAYLIARNALVGVTMTSMFDVSGEWKLRLLSIPRTLWMYLQVVTFPYDLHYYRSVDILQPFLSPLLSLLIVALGIALVIRFLPPPQRPLVLFGLGWFLVALLPTLNIIPLINEYSMILTSEHFLYLPLIGISLVFLKVGQTVLAKFSKGKESPFGIILLSFIICMYMAMTWKQNTYWRGEVPLFERVVRYEKNTGRVRILLAKAYYFNRQYDQAIKEYGKALTIMLGYAKKVQDDRLRKFYIGFVKGIYFDLGHCFLAKEDIRSSTWNFKQALKLDPNDGVLHNSLGLNYVKLNDLEKAVDHFGRAVTLDSHNEMAMNNLAICYLMLGQNQKAEILFRETLRRNPNSLEAQKNLKRLLAEKAKEDYLGQ